MSSADRANLVERLGFEVNFTMPNNPQIKYLKAGGGSGGLVRPAMRSEVSMWCLLSGEPNTVDWPVQPSAEYPVARSWAQHPSNGTPESVRAAHFHGLREVERDG